MDKIKLVGERRALSSLVFGFFGALFTLNAIFVAELRALLLSMGLLYLTAFFSVAAGYFWGRWVALGLAAQGAVSGILLAFQEGVNPIVIFFGVAHALAWLALAGKQMSSAYEGREDWRQKYRIEDGGAERIGKTVTRVTMALPMLIGLLFAPGGGDETTVFACALGALAFWGALRLRAWSPLAAGGAGALLVGKWLSAPGFPAQPSELIVTGQGWFTVGWASSSALLAGVLLLSAFAVFARPTLRFLRR